MLYRFSGMPGSCSIVSCDVSAWRLPLQPRCRSLFCSASMLAILLYVEPKVKILKLHVTKESDPLCATEKSAESGQAYEIKSIIVTDNPPQKLLTCFDLPSWKSRQPQFSRNCNARTARESAIHPKSQGRIVETKVEYVSCPIEMHSPYFIQLLCWLRFELEAWTRWMALMMM